MSGTLSSDSNDSVHNQAEVASQHASTVGTAGSKSSRSMAVLNTAVRHATDGFIGILDMFGFEDPKVNIDISNSQLHLRTSHLKNQTKTNKQKENLVDLIIIIFFCLNHYYYQLALALRRNTRKPDQSKSIAAESVGTLVHQLVCRNDAAFLQHAHLQVEHRVMSGGRHPVRTRAGLRGQRTVH